MPDSISRRGFLKLGGAAAAGLAAGSLALPQVAAAAPEAMLVTVLDLTRCVGCEACVDACREAWQATVPVPAGPIPRPLPPRVKLEDWSGRKAVRDRLTPYNFLYVETVTVAHRGGTRQLHIPRRCLHCVNPPCVNLCPFGAARAEQNGVSHLDPELCLGGAKCRDVCPWHVPQRQSGVGLYLQILPTLAGNGVMFKCHRCLPLLRQGRPPRCVEACPAGVQSIGPRPAMLKAAEALARRRALADGAPEAAWRAYVYGLTENGGTNTIYVSPVPFPAVARAVEEKHAAQRRALRAAGQPVMGNRGRPHLKPVADSMARAENLGLALLAAPVAGVVAGATRLWRRATGQYPPPPPPQAPPAPEADHPERKGGAA